MSNNINEREKHNLFHVIVLQFFLSLEVAFLKKMMNLNLLVFLFAIVSRASYNAGDSNGLYANSYHFSTLNNPSNGTFVCDTQTNRLESSGMDDPFLTQHGTWNIVYFSHAWNKI